ncbi:MAG: hypothetical protein WC959_00485 [Kiritimatiellales bacterium]
MKKKLIAVLCLSGVAGMVSGNYINMTGKGFSYTEDFSSLGVVASGWNDGITVRGVYMISSSVGIPERLGVSYGQHSTGGAYHMGKEGSKDRALGWLTTSGIGQSYIGVRFRNQTGKDDLTLKYKFVLEQWGARNDNPETFVLQYKIHSTNGTENNLNSKSWTDLGSAKAPADSSNSERYIDGNSNQFAIEGSVNVQLRNNQFITFRIIDKYISKGNAMVGLDSITLSVEL